MGGHGAYPHKTKDPVVLAAEMINAWQTIASRENNPVDPIVVTVGSIHGGTKHNIISDEVKMQLTVRTYKKEVRERVLAAIERIAKGIATAAGIPADRMPIVKVDEGSIHSRDLQQSRADQARYRRAEDGDRRRQRDRERPDHGRRRFQRIQPAGSFDPGVHVQRRRGRSGESRREQKDRRRRCRACTRANSRRCRSRPSAPA